MVLLQSQDVVFKQELSYDTVYMGNALQIKYSIQNANGDFQAPDFDGFVIVSGPNVSSQPHIVTFSSHRQQASTP